MNIVSRYNGDYYELIIDDVVVYCFYTILEDEVIKEGYDEIIQDYRDHIVYDILWNENKKIIGGV